MLVKIRNTCIKLKKHLSPIKRVYNLFSRSERQIEAGTEWGSRLEEALNSADIILLLISPGFFASNHCYTEMQRDSRNSLVRS